MKNIMGVMKQVQELQAKQQQMQAELEQQVIEGGAGGGLVTVRLNGKGEMKGVDIDASLLKAEEKEIVEDLILAAHRDARARVDQMMQDKMQEMVGDLPLPPGLKLF